MISSATSASRNHHFLFFFFALFFFFFFSCSSVFASVHHDMIIISPLPFHLETGYKGVGSKEETDDDVQLFNYFIKSERNPNEDPVLLWLTGGPGCSGFSGLVYEIGPLKFDVVKYNGSLPTLGLLMDKAANIMFLDSPVGTGFSYSQSPEGSNSGGDSYSGKTVPLIGKLMSDGNDAGNEPSINLKGYLVGNPITDESLENNS